ncbi:MAG: helix-turn-helix domain-containing protein [Bacilli bacterium]
MEDIGKLFYETREKGGLKIAEVSKDLKLDEKTIENIEIGNFEAFDDIFYLKQYLKDYSKYLGLNTNEIIDAFNEFLFDRTSKIPVEKVRKEAGLSKNLNNPYNLNGNINAKLILLITCLILIVVIIVIMVIL